MQIGQFFFLYAFWALILKCEGILISNEVRITGTGKNSIILSFIARYFMLLFMLSLGQTLVYVLLLKRQTKNRRM